MRVDIGGGTRLFFDVVGSGLEPTSDAVVDKPILLLLHGGPGFDHSSFRPYFDRFADTHQVVYFDHRGQGRSDDRHDPAGWDLDTWADDVERFCDAVGIEQPVVLGNSFGGFVALRYAARHPGHPSKLVLSSTLALSDVELSAKRFGERGGPEAAACYRRLFIDDDPDSAAWAAYERVNLPLYNHVLNGFGPRRTWQNLRVLLHFNRSFRDMDLRDDVAKVAVPTLVLAGRDDPITPWECSQRLADGLADGLGRFEVLDHCGHGSFRDQPDATENLLREFLLG